MILTSTVTPVNGIYKGAVGVQFDPLELSFATAYGEPQIDLTGTFTYTPSVVTPDPTPLALSTSGDYGTVPVAGSVTYNPGTLGDEYVGSGTFNAGATVTPGFFRRNAEVIGDFQFTARLDNAAGYLANPAASNGFIIGLGVFTSDGAGAPGLVAGFGGHLSALEIQLRSRSAQDGALARIAGSTRTNPNGIYLKLVRVSSNITASYSLDNGVSYTSLGTVSISQLAVRVGVFVSSGQGTAATAVFTSTLLQPTPVTPTGTFTIAGGPVLVAMRSSAPHNFQLDSRLDFDAAAKVAGWNAGIRARCSAAKSTLLANANPTTGVVAG